MDFLIRFSSFEKGSQRLISSFTYIPNYVIIVSDLIGRSIYWVVEIFCSLVCNFFMGAVKINFANMAILKNLS
jgi:hypothetical protein